MINFTVLEIIWQTAENLENIQTHLAVLGVSICRTEKQGNKQKNLSWGGKGDIKNFCSNSKSDEFPLVVLPCDAVLFSFNIQPEPITNYENRK